MNWKAYMADTRGQIRNMNATRPETAQAFQALTKASKESGELDLKTRELIALGIAVADRCAPCIGFHVEGLAKAGGTREELADALSVCIQMGGGPSLMYASQALDAWDQLVAVQ